MRAVTELDDTDRIKRFKEAAEWAAAEFERRTWKVLLGVCTYDEILAPYRVPYSEVCSRFNLHEVEPDVISLKEDYTPYAQAALKRRGLLSVARGKVADDVWGKRQEKKGVEPPNDLLRESEERYGPR